VTTSYQENKQGDRLMFCCLRLEEPKIETRMADSGEEVLGKGQLAPPQHQGIWGVVSSPSTVRGGSQAA